MYINLSSEWMWCLLWAPSVGECRVQNPGRYEATCVTQKDNKADSDWPWLEEHHSTLSTPSQTQHHKHHISDEDQDFSNSFGEEVEKMLQVLSSVGNTSHLSSPCFNMQRLRRQEIVRQSNQHVERQVMFILWQLLCKRLGFVVNYALVYKLGRFCAKVYVTPCVIVVTFVTYQFTCLCCAVLVCCQTSYGLFSCTSRLNCIRLVSRVLAMFSF